MRPAGERRRAVWLAALGRTLAAMATVAALLVLVGAITRHPAYQRVLPGLLLASPFVAGAFLAAALALFLMRVSPRASQALAVAALAVGLAAAARPIAGPYEAAALVLLAAGILLLASGRRTAVAAQLVLALVAVWGYGTLLQEAWPGAAGARYPIPVPSAFALLGLGVAALLLAEPDKAILGVVARDDTGGRIARRLLPAALIGIPALAFVEYLAARAGLVEEPSVASVVAGAALLVALVGALAAGSASKADIQRTAAESRYQAVVDSAAEGILTFTPAGKLVLANRSAEAMFERNTEQLVGQNLGALLTARDRGRLEDGVAEFLESGDTALVGRTVQMHGLRAGGVEFPIEVSVAHWRTHDGDYFTAVVRDVSRRQMIEEALRAARKDAEAAARAKADFLANMSHEIRTPMNAIIGMTGLLLETKLDGDQLDFANTIRSSGDHLMTVINDILDFSKIESGKLELEKIPLEVRRLVEESLDLVAHRAQEKRLEIGYLIEGEIPAAIYGDPARLRQILLNLLSNAVKFTREGEVLVRVRSRPKAEAGQHEVEFLVQDTGIGIPPEGIGKLFQMFSQVDTSTTRAFGGTGLGLAISKRLTEMMGGQIGVDSVPGEGSTFHFTVQAEEAPMPEKHKAHSRAELLTGRRVLVVDDNATNRKIFRLQCERWGMRVREAAEPETALEWVRQGENFDLAILDHQMPGMDGAQLAVEIRKYLPADKLPIILASSLGDKPDSYGPELSISSFLTKPVKQSQLLDALVDTLAPEMEEPAAVAAPVAAAAPTAKALRILLAEDNPVNQKVATRMMQKLGYAVEVANNGEEALAAAKGAVVAGKPFDVIFMDVQMPKMDGLEATRRIRAELEGHIHIVAMTADAMPGDRERCLAAGMDDYISKPVRMEVLSGVLARREAEA